MARDRDMVGGDGEFGGERVELGFQGGHEVTSRMDRMALARMAPTTP
jgi:hypothetical protein